MTAQNEEPVVPMNLSDETMVSRRKLLKALAATSGAVVASQILPGQWMKPMIESGVLPAHAQGSPTPTPATTSGFRIFNQTQAFGGVLNACDTGGGGTGSRFETSFEYDDPSGNIIAGKAKVLYDISGTIGSGTPKNEFPIDGTLGIQQTGDGFKGKIVIPWCLRFNNDNQFIIRYQLKNGIGNLSNLVTITVPKPAGALSTDGIGSASIVK